MDMAHGRDELCAALAGQLGLVPTHTVADEQLLLKRSITLKQAT
jgi:hypothetical protein